MEAGIQHMFRSPASAITMEFQGGEPLLAFDKVKFAVERSVELNHDFKKDITFVVCTNSTVFSDDILEFCKQYNIIICNCLGRLFG